MMQAREIPTVILLAGLVGVLVTAGLSRGGATIGDFAIDAIGAAGSGLIAWTVLGRRVKLRDERLTLWYGAITGLVFPVLHQLLLAVTAYCVRGEALPENWAGHLLYNAALLYLFYLPWTLCAGLLFAFLHVRIVRPLLGSPNH